MAVDVEIKCKCGTVRGVARKISAATTNHIVCGCKSCQTYAHFLKMGPEVLNADGGSHIFQMNPKDFEITAGLDQIECARVTEKGPLRWFASCCNTPLGNSFPSGKRPFFVGMFPVAIGQEGTSDEFASLVGPARGYAFPKEKPTFRARLKLWKMLLRVISKIWIWRFSGGGSDMSFFASTTVGSGRKLTLLSAEQVKQIQADAGI